MLAAAVSWRNRHRTSVSVAVLLDVPDIGGDYRNRWPAEHGAVVVVDGAIVPVGLVCVLYSTPDVSASVCCSRNFHRFRNCAGLFRQGTNLSQRTSPGSSVMFAMVLLLVVLLLLLLKVAEGTDGPFSVIHPTDTAASPVRSTSTGGTCDTF